MDFAREIRPILARNCYECHGPEKQQAGLRLDRKADALAGGDSGPAIAPGQAGESELIARVTDDDPATAMPPKGHRLSPRQVERLRAWVAQGAPWPDGGDARPLAGDHWAFRPPIRPAPPAVRRGDWVRNPIDHFVLATLEGLGVSPSPEADRPTLIRRLSLDLLGLPPTPAAVAGFVDDPAPDAYERLVDRLLASPHFGERWGRHWLDLARYADSDGYEKDSPRPHAWRYREWVIAAINGDLPFDRFTIEQLAGDLLPGATTEQRVATGFHRNTLTNTEGGVDKEEFRVAAVVDRVNTTGTAWLGLTVGCAQCHDHKYDPISQEEYYGLFAFFNTGQEVDLPAPPRPEEVRAYERARAKHHAEHARLEAALARYDKDERPEHQAERTRLNAAVAAHAKKAPRPPDARAMTLAENPNPPTTRILIRGDFLRPGAEVRPHTLAILPCLEAAGVSPTRLDLARWLVAPTNPLTARVAANRIWQHLFGRPIVATMEDFGTRGEPPTHPELLDWLAAEFPACGWSTKALIRTIITSATYRQASRTRPELVDRDPNNEWLARQNRFRLEAEVLRDQALTVSGLLQPGLGGPSVRPPQPPGISELTYAGSARWVESTGPDRYRRGLYTWFQRTSPYPMLATFDAPDANVCAARRERSDTPLQALTLLNDAVFVECAQALGRRIVAESPRRGTEARIAHAFRLGLGREPTAAEAAALVRLYETLLRQCRSAPEQAAKLAGPWKAPGVEGPEGGAWVALARTILNLDEFITRE